DVRSPIQASAQPGPLVDARSGEQRAQYTYTLQQLGQPGLPLAADTRQSFGAPRRACPQAKGKADRHQDCPRPQQRWQDARPRGQEDDRDDARGWGEHRPLEDTQSDDPHARTVLVFLESFEHLLVDPEAAGDGEWTESGHDYA